MDEKLERINAVPKLPPRRRDGHKGEYGRVLIVGGSRGMVGAVALAANAALRGGAGLVSFAAPEPIQLTIASLCPCATSAVLSCGPDGAPGPAAVAQMLTAAERCDVLAVGPGMDTGGGQKNLIRAALERTKPLVLDADGLNNLAAIDGWAAIRRCPLVLTPHPGEFSRLTGSSIRQIQSDRERSATAAARRWAGASAPAGPLVCVLKGAGTVVTDGRRLYVNDTGNPGMATGGSGDVLTGLVAAFLAQKLEPFEAACLAVHVHGRAGDRAGEKLGQVSITAGDLLDYLPDAIRERDEAAPGD